MNFRIVEQWVRRVDLSDPVIFNFCGPCAPPHISAAVDRTERRRLQSGRRGALGGNDS